MSVKLRQCLLAMVITAGAGAGPGMECLACRYSVRDVAFVAFPDEFYPLYVYVDSDIEQWRAAMSEVNDSLLVETNVRARLVTDDDESQDYVRHARDLKLSERPAAVLVRRDGGGLPLPLEGSSPAEILQSLCRRATESPQRNAIVGSLLSSHSSVLLIEGPDAEQNQLARSWVDEVIPLVNQSLAFLPKPIRRGPELVVIPQGERDAEAVLLWSLGLDRQSRESTHLVVLMGRGRQVGPRVTLPGAERVELERSLAVVGQDCECGLDRRWMQGEMIPHVWGQQQERQAVAELGFDPGSPGVAAEISRILARSPTQRGMEDIDLSLAPLGLQIIELTPIEETPAGDTQQPAAETIGQAPAGSGVPPPSEQRTSDVPSQQSKPLDPAGQTTTDPPGNALPAEVARQDREVPSHAVRTAQTGDEMAPATSYGNNPWRPVVWTAAGLLCLAAVAGIWILARSGRTT